MDGPLLVHSIGLAFLPLEVKVDEAQLVVTLLDEIVAPVVSALLICGAEKAVSEYVQRTFDDKYSFVSSYLSNPSGQGLVVRSANCAVAVVVIEH